MKRVQWVNSANRRTIRQRRPSASRRESPAPKSAKCAAKGSRHCPATEQSSPGWHQLLTLTTSTANVLRKGSELARPQLVGWLSLFYDPPAFERSQEGLGEEIGQRGRREKLNKVAFVGALRKVVGVVEGAHDFVPDNSRLAHLLAEIKYIKQHSPQVVPHRRGAVLCRTQWKLTDCTQPALVVQNLAIVPTRTRV